MEREYRAVGAFACAFQVGDRIVASGQPSILWQGCARSKAFRRNHCWLSSCPRSRESIPIIPLPRASQQTVDVTPRIGTPSSSGNHRLEYCCRLASSPISTRKSCFFLDGRFDSILVEHHCEH